MLFWQNPEFVRYVRAELRPARALTSAALALVICTLVGLSSWGGRELDNSRDFFQDFYLWTMGIQYVVLTFWCASACGHAISRERELKTFDFLKTTRLTAAEILMGKVLGVPVLAYFTVGCTLPISALLGIMAGYSLATLFWTYVLLLALALFVSLMALWASMQVEGSSARFVGLLVLIPVTFGYSLVESPFPGFGAASVFPALFSFYRGNTYGYMTRITPTFFGWPVSFIFLTLILYVSFGAWFVLMIIRNLKKDIEDMRLLSRWQAIGFAVFLNVLFYAFLNPKMIAQFGSFTPGDVSGVAVAVNVFILFLIGIAMLTPHEKLKVWWRKHATHEQSYFSESGPPWPWLVPAALIAYAMLAAEAMGLQGSISLDQWRLGRAALDLGVFLVFVTRDILFLQWTILTRMKRPVLKGILYLCLYYLAAGIIVSVISVVSPWQSRFLAGILTPFGVLDPEGVHPSVSPGIYLGLIFQFLAIMSLLGMLELRLRKPAIIPTLSEG